MKIYNANKILNNLVMTNIYLATIHMLIVLSEAKPFCSEDDNMERNLEAQLKTSLFCEYDTDSRPVTQHNKTIDVVIDLELLSVKTTEETAYSSDTVAVNCITVMIWHDSYLNWSHIPKYKSINMLAVPSYKVWMPNVILVNSEYRHSTKNWDGYCFISPDGEVSCFTATTYYLSCKTDFRRWPYDSMNCTMTFKTWMQPGEAVNLTMSEYQLEAEELDTVNEEQHYWRIESMRAHYFKRTVKSLSLTFSSVNYSFILKRHTATWATLVIGPILVMISLVLTSYTLDLDSLERMSLLGIAVLCHFFYMLQINWYLPASGNSCPMIILCIRASLIINVMAVLQTLILRYLEGCTSDSVDSLLRILEKATGKVFTFRGFQKMDSTQGNGETNNATKLKWGLFTVFLNRVFLTVSTFTYFVTFLATIML